MDVEKVRKYIGMEVLLILNNGYKFTVTLPEFDGNSFSAKDKFGKEVEIGCEMISMIYEKGEDNEPSK